MIESTVYKALGDPARLEIVKRLARKPNSTVGELSSNLGMTRQGARKQLQVLVDADIVRLTPRGRQTEVTLNAQSLQRAREFITQIERQWDDRLAALKAYVEHKD